MTTPDAISRTGRASADKPKGIGIDVCLTFARQFVAGFLKLVVIVMVARGLGPDGAGAYALSLLLPTMLSQLLNFGLVSANVYFVASRRFDLQHVWSASRDAVLVVGAVGTLFGAALIIAAGPVIFPGVATTYLLVALGIFPINLLSGIVVGLFQARQNFRLYNLIVMTEPMVTIVLMAASWLVLGPSLISALLAAIIGYSLTLLVGLAALSGDLRLCARTLDRWVYLRPAFRYGLLAHLSNLVTFINYRLDIYLVNLFLGPAATGVYTIAVRLAEQVWIISQAVSTVIFPRLSSLRGQDSDSDLLAVTIARFTLWATLGASGALVLIAPPLISSLFGKDFSSAASVFVMLLPGIVLLAGFRILANSLAARGMVTINFGFSLIILAVNVISTLTLIPAFNLHGAALATSIAYSVGFILAVAAYSRMSDVRWWQIIIPSINDFRSFRKVIGLRRWQGGV
jgi:O-antigen/teichoic acid export membrane protein